MSGHGDKGDAARIAPEAARTYYARLSPLERKAGLRMADTWDFIARQGK